MEGEVWLSAHPGEGRGKRGSTQLLSGGISTERGSPPAPSGGGSAQVAAAEKRKSPSRS